MLPAPGGNMQSYHLPVVSCQRPSDLKALMCRCVKKSPKVEPLK
jgi:hypothetical protein